MEKEQDRTVAVNRQVHHEYFVLETLEAGIELVGTEVKSIRNHAVNLKDAWVDIQNGEMFLLGCHISPYEKGNIFNRDPVRDRKLLVHKKEIRRLQQEIKTQGQTLIPLSMYFKGSRVKVSIGLCKGKKLYDKREDDAKRTAKREMERADRDNY